MLTRTAMLLVVAASAAATQTASWRHDPAWDAGKAEWALYDASRVIYGVPRAYEATIFTNTQHMDGETTTKSDRGGSPGTVPVFKHNVSEIVPTENYEYRFLTTCFVHRDTLDVYKLAVSTQEDCGATYKQFVVDGGEVDATSFCYFPDTGAGVDAYRVPGRASHFTFHDALTLRLRDYPFDAEPKPEMKLKLVEEQTSTKPSETRPEEALVRYVDRETVDVPFGSVDTHHVVVEHETVGGATRSDYWFAADPAMRHVLVKYEGPFGVTYALKRLEWWAYWGEPRP